MTMKVRSLFSGVGGVDLGLERAGMEVISQCEKDDYRRAILRRHWPHAEVHDDVQSVHYEAGSADLLCGGFPCQDLSVAGRRRGLAGSRSGLFFEFARIADECVPEGGWLLLENVPGLLSSHEGRDFGVLLRTLADIGFSDIAWRVLDSRYFGVPQRRRRVFILARRATGTRAAQVLLEPEGDGGHPQEGRKKAAKRPVTPAGSAGNGSSPALAGGGEGEAPRSLSKGPIGAMGDIAPALTRGYGKNSGIQDGKNGPINVVIEPVIANALDRMRGGADDNDAQANHIVAATGVLGDQAHTLTSEGMDASEDGTGRGTPVIASSLLAPSNGRGGSYRLDDHDVHGNHVLPVGLGKDINVSGTLGKKGVGGGGLGLDREGAMVIEETAPNNPAGALAFNWQSGGDVRLGVLENEVPTLQRQQVPAVQVLIAPEIAAPLTAGHATGEGISKPGRRMEDDKNLVVFGAWNMKILDEGDAAGSLLGGSKGAQYSLNNMPLVAKCLTNTAGRWDYETETIFVHATDEYPTLRSNDRNNSNPATEAKMHVVHEAKAVSENQRAEVLEGDVIRSTTKGGGKPGQGYPAARVVTDETDIAGLVRRLTPTECERLQGFPDGWTHKEGESLAPESSWYEVGILRTDDGAAILVPRVSDIGYLDRLLASMMGAVDIDEPKPDGRRYAAMGDAVTVPVAHWIGARLMKYGN